MACYKQKIQKELKKAMERFQRQYFHPFKTHFIQKKHKIQKSTLKSKRFFKPLFNRYQKDYTQDTCQEGQLFNFYNILTIDESALHEPHEPVSYLKNLFYTKTTRKIQVHENYLVFQLADNGILPSSIPQTLEKYRNSSNPNLKKLAVLLQELQRKLSFASLEASNQTSITQDAYKLFDSLGQSLFLSKIAGQRLVISKSLLQLCQWDIEKFIMQSLIFKIPAIQGPLRLNYFQFLSKQIENYSRMIDFLQGSIPLSLLVQISKMSYVDYITTRANVTYECVMSLSMPIPLVQLITIGQPIASQHLELKDQSTIQSLLKIQHRRFQEKSYQTLQHLINLPINRQPQNYNKVAQYIEVNHNNSVKNLENQTKISERVIVGSQPEKSPLTDQIY